MNKKSFQERNSALIEKQKREHHALRYQLQEIKRKHKEGIATTPPDKT